MFIKHVLDLRSLKLGCSICRHFTWSNLTSYRYH